MNQKQSQLIKQSTKLEKMYYAFPGSLVGFLAIFLAFLSIGLSSLFFYQELGYFSFLQVFISTLGDTPGRTMIAYTIGMAMLNICKILFLFYFSGYLVTIQVKKYQIWLNIAFSLMNSSGWVLMTIFSASGNEALHEIGAMIFFFGVVLSQSVIAVFEIKQKSKFSSLMIISTIFVILSYLAFFSLFMIISFNSTFPRSPAVLTEWLCFISVLFWLGIHSGFLWNFKKASQIDKNTK